MKRFSSEFCQSYDTYSFGYATYATLDSHEGIADAYDQGFLPYSGGKTEERTLYMARSARIPLSSFELSSENRRIARRFDGTLTRTETSVKEFNVNDTFLSFCAAYFSGRFGEKVMPRTRIEHVLSSGFATHVITYAQGEKPIAYVIEARDENMSHFWFSFYDLSLVKQSLGLWLMLDCAREAKARSNSHFYLGTVYGEKALYKTNFEPLEFWDGYSWNSDVSLLRSLGRTDHDRTHIGMDLWKAEHLGFD